VIDWAEQETRTTVYSCLASHIALNHLFGLERDIQDTKTFGVYCHDIVEQTWLTQGLSTPLRSPHSRWGGVPTKLLHDAGVTVAAESFEAGWLLGQVSSAGHETVFLQGHPEYWRDDLLAEYRRDAASGQPIPENYFPNNDPTQTPRYDWHASAHQLFANITQVTASLPKLVTQQ
jgi:homoserine O-succinyltransferase